MGGVHVLQFKFVSLVEKGFTILESKTCFDNFTSLRFKNLSDPVFYQCDNSLHDISFLRYMEWPNHKWLSSFLNLLCQNLSGRKSSQHK